MSLSRPLVITEVGKEEIGGPPPLTYKSPDKSPRLVVEGLVFRVSVTISLLRYTGPFSHNPQQIMGCTVGTGFTGVVVDQQDHWTFMLKLQHTVLGNGFLIRVSEGYDRVRRKFGLEWSLEEGTVGRSFK